MLATQNILLQILCAKPAGKPGKDPEIGKSECCFTKHHWATQFCGNACQHDSPIAVPSRVLLFGPFYWAFHYCFLFWCQLRTVRFLIDTKELVVCTLEPQAPPPILKMWKYFNSLGFFIIYIFQPQIAKILQGDIIIINLIFYTV